MGGPGFRLRHEYVTGMKGQHREHIKVPYQRCVVNRWQLTWQRAGQRLTESPCCTPETNRTSCANHTSIKTKNLTTELKKKKVRVEINVQRTVLKYSAGGPDLIPAASGRHSLGGHSLCHGKGDSASTEDSQQ